MILAILSGADKSKITPFMKMFWEEQQKYMSLSKKGVRYHPYDYSLLSGTSC